MSTKEAVEQSVTLTAEQVEDLQLSFAAMDPVSFARHLHTLHIPDAIKREWLGLKVSQKPTEREDVMRKAIESATQKFWNQLSAARP